METTSLIQIFPGNKHCLANPEHFCVRWSNLGETVGDSREWIGGLGLFIKPFSFSLVYSIGG